MIDDPDRSVVHALSPRGLTEKGPPTRSPIDTADDRVRRDQIVVGVEKLEARSGFPLLHAAGLELTRACLKASPGEAKLFPDESFRIGKIDRINPALIRYLIEK